MLSAVLQRLGIASESANGLPLSGHFCLFFYLCPLETKYNDPESRRMHRTEHVSQFEILTARSEYPAANKTRMTSLQLDASVQTVRFQSLVAESSRSHFMTKPDESAPLSSGKS